MSRTLVVMAVRNHCTGSGFEGSVDTAHSCGLTHPTGVGLEGHRSGRGDELETNTDATRGTRQPKASDCLKDQKIDANTSRRERRGHSLLLMWIQFITGTR